VLKGYLYQYSETKSEDRNISHSNKCISPLTQLLCQYEACISEYDKLHFSSIELLLQEEDFHYLVDITFPKGFPQVFSGSYSPIAADYLNLWEAYIILTNFILMHFPPGCKPQCSIEVHTSE